MNNDTILQIISAYESCPIRSVDDLSIDGIVDATDEDLMAAKVAWVKHTLT